VVLPRIRPVGEHEQQPVRRAALCGSGPRRDRTAGCPTALLTGPPTLRPPSRGAKSVELPIGDVSRSGSDGVRWSRSDDRMTAGPGRPRRGDDDDQQVEVAVPDTDAHASGRRALAPWAAAAGVRLLEHHDPVAGSGASAGVHAPTRRETMMRNESFIETARSETPGVSGAAGRSPA
jgi:hypothetical protein